MVSPELLRRFPFFGFMNEKQLKAVAMIADEFPLENEKTSWKPDNLPIRCLS
jgi:hypothetical protein